MGNKQAQYKYLNDVIRNSDYDYNPLFGDSFLRVFVEYEGKVNCFSLNFIYDAQRTEFYKLLVESLFENKKYLMA